MRTHHLALALALTGACKWTDFDDLAETTWVRSTQDPDIGASDYAVAIVGVTTGASGGSLAVVSDDTANFSSIEYSAAGDADVGANPVRLGDQRIGAIAEQPVFITDGSGRVALVERSITGGNFAVILGTATAPAGIEFASMSNPTPPPDAGVFVPNGSNADLVFAAGETLYKVPSGTGTPIACTGTDNNGMPLQAAALAHDGTNLWVWTKSGSLISYPLTALDACTDPLPSPGAIAFTPTGGFTPAPGAQVHIVGGAAILTGHPPQSRSGSIFVVDLATGMQIGSTLNVEGLRTSTVGMFSGSDLYLAVGVPDRPVDNLAAGAVDLYAFNATTGALDATPALTLHDAQPEAGQLFGRALTTMTFNGSPILVVAGNSEVYAYYRTTLYDHLP